MEKTKLIITVLFIAAFIVLGAAGLLLSKCGGNHPAVESAPAAEKRPETVHGLEVTGPRTRANVVANMVPAIRRMQAVYAEHRERNRSLRGRIELRLSVEWTGEINLIEIASSTLSDPEFEKAVIRPLQYMDFDGWGRSDENTEILYPVTFG